MQLATITPVRPAAPSTDVFVRPGEPAPAAPAAQTPESKFMSDFTEEVFGVMGTIGLGYSLVSAPGEIHIRFANYDLATLGDNALADSVRGLKLVMCAPDGAPYDMTATAADWVSSPTNVARAIAAMPGVVSYKYANETSLVFTPTSTDTRIKLQELVSRTLPRGYTGYWSGEFDRPQPPKPTPAPTSGARA